MAGHNKQMLFWPLFLDYYTSMRIEIWKGMIPLSIKITPPPIMQPATGKAKRFEEGLIGSFEIGFISPAIVLGKHSYRLLGIYSGRNGKISSPHFHKFHIFNEEGKVVEKEEIASYCLQVYLTFYTIMISKKDIEHSLQHQEQGQLRTNLAEIKETLVSRYEKEYGRPLQLLQDFDKMLDYMETVHPIEEQMAELAIEINEMEEKFSDQIEEEPFAKLAEAMNQFKKLARQKGISLMQNQGALRMVRSLLQNNELVKYLSTAEKDQANEIIEKIDQEIEYEQIVYTTHDMTLITPKSYIKKLQQTPEDFIRLKAEEFLRKRWLLHKKPFFLDRFIKTKVQK